MFPKFDQRLVLTDPRGAGVSNWRLPRWFYPDGNKPPMTYHPDRRRWRRDTEHAYLQTVGRGQEFVLDLAHYPEAVEWIFDIVSSLGSDTRSCSRLEGLLAEMLPSRVAIKAAHAAVLRMRATLSRSRAAPSPATGPS